MSKIVEITDLEAPELEPFARLTEAQLRSRRAPEKGIFIAEGLKVIGLALDAGCEPLSFLMERRHVSGKAAEILRRCGDVPVHTAETELLEKLTGFKLTRGVLCALRRPTPFDAGTICAGAHRVVVLEGVADPTNVGAVFRSAAALGIDAVLLTASCCDPLQRRAARVSMGTVFQVPWAYLGASEWPERGLEMLQGLGFKSAAMALDDKALIIESPLLSEQERLAIVLGTEGDGLAKNTIASCDYTVYIPMSRGVDSLNAASAAAVAFWQLRRR